MSSSGEPPSWFWHNPRHAPPSAPPPEPPSPWWKRAAGAMWREFLAFSSGTKILLALILSCLVFSVCSGVAATVERSLNATPTTPSYQVSSSAQDTPTANATAAPTATATPAGPHLISGPTLGGTAAAFAAAFGQPTDNYGLPYYAFTTSGGVSASVCFCSTVGGTDGKQRVDLLSVSAPGQDYSQGLGILKTFLPPDARFVSTLYDPQVGPMQIYQSPNLALTFPAYEFKDSNGGALLPPGTLSVVCQDPAQVACTMATGE